MPFLIPAIIAFISDTIIIWLNRLASSSSSSLTESAILHLINDDNNTSNSTTNSTTLHESSNFSILYNVNYLAPLAGIRILLLLLPILYHSYTGTAVRYVPIYQLLYSLSLITIFIHIISLFIVNPTSIESIFPGLLSNITINNNNDSNSNNTTSTVTDNHHHRMLQSIACFSNNNNTIQRFLELVSGDNDTSIKIIVELRRIWWMLLLSLLSVLCHWILLYHVRSTAPISSYYYYSTNNNNNRKPSVYFTVRTASSYTSSTTDNEPALIHAMNEFVIDMQCRLQRAKMEWSARLEDFGTLIGTSSSTTGSSYSTNNSNGAAFRDFPSMAVTADGQYGHSAFVAIEQQQHPSFTRNGTSYNLNSNNSSIDNLQQQQYQQHQIQQQRHNTSLVGGLSNPLFVAAPIQPFRILLQLFAYEDVLENNKLDTLYDIDNGETITFFVPQLLSFLLHGALYSSPLLEEWVLNKCRHNVHFAHRCYWFLRAWCLEAPAEVRQSITNTNNTNNRYKYSRSISNTSGGSFDDSGLAPFLDEPAPNVPLSSSTDNGEHDDNADYSHFDDTCGPNSFAVRSPISSIMHSCTPSSVAPVQQHPLLLSDHNSTSFHRKSNLSLSGLNNHNNTSDKLLPEERVMIEHLMLRIKECGEIPARRLEFGPSYTHQNESTGNSLNGANNNVDENDGNRLQMTTTKHQSTIIRGGDEMTSPLSEDSDASWEELSGSNNNNNYSMAAMLSAAESNLIPVHPVTGEPSLAHYQAMATQGERFGFLPLSYLPSSTNNNNDTTMDTTEYFDKTPRFLDALIFLAESLFLVPRDERKQTLQHQLRTLECELLPSNSIYLPLGGNRVHHSVWRIVAEESIPISTKERVPCIIPMEVIERGGSGNDNISTSFSPSRRLISSIDGINNQHIRSVSEGVVSWNEPRRVRDDDDIYKDLFDQTIQQSPKQPSRYRVFSADADVTAVTESLPSPPPTESKVLKDWIHGHRPPYRRTSLLDKVATTVKVPLEKMKIQVRDRFMNRKVSSSSTTSEELQPLSSYNNNNYINDDDDRKASYKKSPPTITKRLNTTIAARNDARPPYPIYKDVERIVPINNGATTIHRNDDDGAHSGPHSRNLSRIGSEGSLVSLGQWSSQFANSDNTSNGRTDDRAKRRKIFLELKRRLDNDSKPFAKQSTKSGNGGQLVYGSDHEDDPNDVRKLSIRRSTIEIPLSVPNQTQSTDIEKSNSTRTPPVVFRESWCTKQERIRKKSAFGNHPGWKLVPVLIKANDDLRQEQLACQLIHRIASILAHDKIPVWLYPYEIIATTDSGGLIEAVPDTISLDSLKKNGGYKSLKDFFVAYFGEATSEEMAMAKANFVESLAAYSIVCFLLQIKDRHNGNILLDNKGHIIHIDFGFFFLSSPGKNVGFESAPFKLTREFVEVLDGPTSHLFRIFRTLCVKTFIALRRRCMEIILLVEMIKVGNEELPCFRSRPDDAIQQLRERFRLDLNDRACEEYVNSLIDASIENWRTDWYDRYQRYFVGIL